MLLKLRVEFSDLRAHRFNHKFNCRSPVCKCGTGDETTEHYLTRCPLYSTHRSNLLNDITSTLNNDASIFPDAHLNDLLLYGSSAYNHITNRLILDATIIYTRKKKRFKTLEAFDNQPQVLNQP